ncbi:MAG: hypothetical protein HKN16_03680 [Saprospiraceae bacterium]|nr:hypothetical protein [Saprospiraceae bacterium]
MRHTYFFALVLFTILLFLSCSRAGWDKISSVPAEIVSSEYQVPEGLPDARDWESYVADDKHLDHLPMKRLRVNYHFMNSEDGTRNYNEKKAGEYAYYLTRDANAKLAENQAAHLPLHNDIPVYKAQYKYRKTSSTGQEGKKGVYVHYDDENYFYVKQGKNKNIGDRTVFKEYGVDMESIINVFMMPHHPDSLKSKTYSGGLTGVALGMHTKIVTTSPTEVDAWKNCTNFNHELGHILGLPHSWGNDGCDDTPRHNNECWNFTKNGSKCDSLVSNNLMSYNNFQNSMTPCQIGRVHMNMANNRSRIRKYIMPDWCTFDPENSITISEKIYWTGNKDLHTDIIIQDGAELYICSRISMAPGSRIIVENGGKLILDKARLHNDCGEKWRGIWKSKKGKSEIIFMNNPLLQDIQGQTENPES